jgi:hypothetical protein
MANLNGKGHAGYLDLSHATWDWLLGRPLTDRRS